MDIAKIFSGEDDKTASIDEALFNRMFYTGVNKHLYVIKSKLPLPYQDITSQHAHSNYEFTIPLSHSPKLLIEKKEFALPRRNIFPTNPGQSHGPAEVAREHRIIAMQLVPRELQEIAHQLYGKKKVEFQNLPVPFNLHLENLIDMFLYENQNKQLGYEFILEHLNSLIGATLLRTLNSNLQLPEKPLTSLSKNEIKKALDFLQVNLNQDFSLTELANQVGLSKFHFIRLFKKETGKTPYQYYIEMKIKKATELIRTQKHSITEICFMCGFKDHSHFSRVFLKKTGMTPTAFKLLCK